MTSAVTLDISGAGLEHDEGLYGFCRDVAAAWGVRMDNFGVSIWTGNATVTYQGDDEQIDALADAYYNPASPYHGDLLRDES